MKRLLGTDVATYGPPAFLFVFTVAYLIVAYGYSPASRAFPVIVAWSMIVLVTIDLISRTQTRAGRAHTRWLIPTAATTAGHDNPLSRVEIIAVSWVAALVAAMALIGILYAIPLFVFASVRWRGQRSYAASLAIASITTLLVWLLFTRVLRIELYSGLLGSG